MAVSKERREQINRYDAEHMSYQTVKVRRELLDDFKYAVAARGDKVNAVMRESMEQYVKESKAILTPSDYQWKT